MTYLDHNATSPLRPSAKRVMLAVLEECGNASSVHAYGRKARAHVNEARDKVARLAGADPASVIFTSGATEANMAALRGAIAGALAEDRRITRIFFSAVEHESVRANVHALTETVPGLKAAEIPVTADGVVDMAEFRLKLMHGKGRALVSVMAANNETGVIQDIAAIAALLRAEGGEASLLHVDAVQAAGRMALLFDAWAADYMTLSAHKFGGPQGVGALLVKGGAPFSPLVVGGGQEMGRRSGTENVAAITGFGAASDDAHLWREDMARLAALRARWEQTLKDIAPDAVIFGANAPRLANTSNFAIPDVSAETALIALDLDGIAVSSGSACSSGKIKPSHVLAAMGVDEALARSSLRVSFGWNSREEDMDALAVALRRLLARRAGRKAA